MRRTKRLAVAVAAAAMLTSLLSTSAFADSRNQNETRRGTQDRGQDRDRSNGSDRGGVSRNYRDHERVTAQGRVRSFRQAPGGYRVLLDNGRYPYFVPSTYLRNRARNGLRIGVAISLGGIFRGGSIYVDNVGWPDGGYYDDRYDDGRYNDGDDYRNNSVRGVVEHVDYRRELIELRDEYSGRRITVDMGRVGRRWNRSDLRRGSFIVLTGDWDRGGVFTAYRVERVRSGRY